MKVIIIDGVIGWDVYGRSVRRALEAAGGEEIEIHIASPGGFVYDGLEVFNLIRDYARDKEKGSVTIILKGLAASMASYIALAGDVLKAEDNTVFMLHNPYGGIVGDYRAMQENAEYLESMTNLLAKAYSQKSGKPLSEIRELMDSEKWYFGDEMNGSGFIDEIIETENDKDKDSAIFTAQARVKNMFAKMKEHERAKEDLERAAAMINVNQKTSENITDDLKNENTDPAAIAGKNNTEERLMTLEELMAKHPEIYAQAVQVGVEKGIHQGTEKEFDRVKAHITLGRQAGALELAVKNIEEKKEFSLTVSAEYQAEGMKNQDIENRNVDDETLGEIPAGGVDDDEADTKAFVAELKKRGGK